jgi:hypothetical protein
MTGEDWGTNKGVQPSSIMKMVDRLIEPRDDRNYKRHNMLKVWERKWWQPYWLYALNVMFKGAF